MNEKRFRNVIVRVDGNTEIMLEDKDENFFYRAVSPLVERLLNYFDVEMKKLKEENEQLRQKKHWVYVDVDNANGCMNCNHNVGSICSILNCGTHDYLVGVSECGLKYWESLI